MVRPPSFDSNGMKKGAWSEEEDNKLRAYVLRYGHWNWRLLPKYAGLARCGKSCRLRWVNYLKPGVKRGNFTKEEEDLVNKLHAQLGNRWSDIAKKFPGRTDNEIKNFYHTRIEKRRKRNPGAKVRGHRSESSSKDEVMGGENASEITLCQKTRDEPELSEATSLEKLQQSTPSFDPNASVLTNTQAQMDTWPDIFQDEASYDQTDGFPPLIEDEFFYPELQYSELSSSDSSYMSALDWIADDDRSIMSSEYVAPSVQASFWSGSSASSTLNSLSESPPQGVGGLYDDPLFPCFDYGMNLFS